MTPVKSSMIKAVGWKQPTLLVRFNSGALYEYHGVPKRVYLKLLTAHSVGRAFNHLVKGQYLFQRVE